MPAPYSLFECSEACERECMLSIRGVRCGPLLCPRTGEPVSFVLVEEGEA